MRTLSGLIAALSLWAVPASPQTENWMARAEMRFHQNLIDRVGAAETRKIAPFTTDGCSGGLSWSWERLVDLVSAKKSQTQRGSLTNGLTLHQNCFFSGLFGCCHWVGGIRSLGIPAGYTPKCAVGEKLFLAKRRDGSLHPGQAP